MATLVKYNGPLGTVTVKASDGVEYTCPFGFSVSLPDDTAIALFAEGTFTAPDGSTPGYVPSSPVVFDGVFLANGVLSKYGSSGSIVPVSGVTVTKSTVVSTGVQASDLSGINAAPASYIKAANGNLNQALAGWRAAKAASETTPAVILVAGHSIPAGYTLTDGVANGWPNRLKQLLVADGHTWYGEAYSAAPYMGSAPQIANPSGPFTTTSVLSTAHQLDAGLGRIIYDSAHTAVSLQTINVPVGAVACDIIWLAYTAGTWKYQVDAAAQQTVTATPTTGGTQQQNAVLCKTTIACTGASTIKLGFQNASLVFMPSLVAFRYNTKGIGMIVQVMPAGSAADEATGAGTTTASAVSSTTPGISAPNDKLQPWTGVNNANNTCGSGWPLNPSLAIFSYYANSIGRGSDPDAERRALERKCRAIRTQNDACSFLFLIDNIPDEVYSASNYETQQFVAERASLYKSMYLSVAHSVGGAIVDIDQKWGQTGVAQGFLPANNVHPTGTGATSSDGHYDIAQALHGVI